VQPAVDGFLPSAFVETSMETPPAPNPSRLLDADRLDLTFLEPLVELRAWGVDVALVEMPAAPNSLALYVDGERDHDRFVDQLHRFAEAYDVPFWPAPPLDLIPKDGWRDRGHLNSRGAAAFSTWLAQAVAATPSLRPYRDAEP
jgi:hypothetical protein